MEYRNELIDIDKIIEPPEPIRNQIDNEAIFELADSIKRFGLINPITLTERNGKFEIIAGHRRFLAIKTLLWTQIPSRVLDKEESQNTCVSIIENLQRVNLNPIEEMYSVSRLHHEEKMSLNHIAESLSRSIGWVQSRIELIQYPLDLLQAIESEKINLSVAKELVKIEDDSMRKFLLDNAVNSGANSRTVSSWVYDYFKEKNMQEVVQNTATNRGSPVNPQDLSFICYVCDTKHDLRHCFTVRLCRGCYNHNLEVKAKE